MKPVKAWSIVNKNGVIQTHLLPSGKKVFCIYPKEKTAYLYVNDFEKVIQKAIIEVPNAKE